MSWRCGRRKCGWARHVAAAARLEGARVCFPAWVAFWSGMAEMYRTSCVRCRRGGTWWSRWTRSPSSRRRTSGGWWLRWMQSVAVRCSPSRRRGGRLETRDVGEGRPLRPSGRGPGEPARVHRRTQRRCRRPTRGPSLFDHRSVGRERVRGPRAEASVRRDRSKLAGVSAPRVLPANSGHPCRLAHLSPSPASAIGP
jgi:hypothetical protein